MKIYKAFPAKITVISLIFISLNGMTWTITANSEWDIRLTQSFLDCSGNQVCYQVELLNTSPDNWTLGDQNYRLFFDGDLMTVVSVSSLLPGTYYSTANIDQNIKISGQGQEAASPLDDIDDNLGFLDFSITQTDKSNPNGAAILQTGVYAAVAEICVTVAPLATSGANDENCLSFYHSRPSTAGSFTTQYTTITENYAPNSTISSNGGAYDDLTAADGSLACLSNACAPSGDWNIQLSQQSLDCSSNQVCYHLELESNSTESWTLGDQNYRLFFDGDLMTITSVTSLLPNTHYSSASIDQNIKITGQGQETNSPLDDIDDHLGFLDFTIVQTNKNTPNAAVQLNPNTFLGVAEICVNIDNAVFNDQSGNTCLAFYHSRPGTAGSITTQYTTISENDAPGSTTTTEGGNYDDLTSADGTIACIANDCTSSNVCDIQVTVSPPNYNDNGTPDNTADDSFTFQITITGSNHGGWTGGGQSGSYGDTATYGPYAVDGNGALFQVSDISIGSGCFTSVGVNASSCIQTGVCACCQSN